MTELSREKQELQMNLTGLLTFILPLTFSFLDFRYTSIIVCIIATIAAIQEGYFLRTKNQDNKDFSTKKKKI